MPLEANAARQPIPWEESVRPDDAALSRLKAANIADFIAMEIPPRKMVLAPVLPEQGLVMLYAPRGIGKTFVSLSLAYAVASGGRFLRWTAPEPRRVLFLDGEMPASDIQERLSWIINGSAAQLPSDDYFTIVSHGLQTEGFPNLSSTEGQDAIEEHLDGVSLMVLDNLSTLCRYGRENDAESWDPVQQWLLDLRRRGISVLLVHHAGKGGLQRGTSKREDVLDTVISLKRPNDYHSEEGARFEVHLEKARGIAGDDAKAFEASLTVRDEAVAWTTRDIADVEMDVVKQLTAEGSTVRDIAEETGFSKSKVNRIQKRLRSEEANG